MADIEVSSGPYGVHGLPLVRMRLESTGDASADAWVERDAVDTSGQADEDGTYWLCRCGQSQNKPFCDGSHNVVGFEGTETADRSAYRDRAKVMQGEGIVVRDVRPLCEHAGFCGTQGTNVWRMVGSNDPDELATMASMIDRCPSGALTKALSTTAPDDEPDLPLKVGVVDDGPYLVMGGAQLASGDGTAYESRNRMTLCRCGASANKPFCDGTHAEVRFTDR
jgi:CDGSH-type Zn-finger protein